MSVPAYLPADLTPSDVWRPYAQSQNQAQTANSFSGTGGTSQEIVEPWGEDGFTFADLIDIINPLQHIPVVSTFYRRMTGDEIAPAAQFIGSGLLGGVPGLMIAGANVAVEEATGQDIGETVLAALIDDDAVAPDQPSAKLAALAQATTAAPASPSETSAPERTVVASAGLASFFAPPRPVSPAGSTNQAALGPGAIQNKFFRPEAAIRAAAIQANAPQTATSAPATSTAPALSPPIPSAISTGPVASAASLANEVSAADTKRIAANRAALLAVAKDLRTTIESHQAYNANERLKQLYRAQDGLPLRPAQ